MKTKTESSIQPNAQTPGPLDRAPWKANGHRYCSGPDGERICLGAMMGRANEIPPDAHTIRKLRLVRVRPSDGGDYDQGGAYWGDIWSRPLYCAFGDSDTEQAVFWVRAPNREEAKRKILSQFPSARFFR